MVLFMNQILSSAWPLPWWLYDNDTPYLMKLVPSSVIILHGNPYAGNSILWHFMSFSAGKHSAIVNCWELVVVIYNEKEIAVFESKYVSVYYFCGLPVLS